MSDEYGGYDIISMSSSIIQLITLDEYEVNDDRRAIL